MVSSEPVHRRSLGTVRGRGGATAGRWSQATSRVGGENARTSLGGARGESRASRGGVGGGAPIGSYQARYSGDTSMLALEQQLRDEARGRLTPPWCDRAWWWSRPHSAKPSLAEWRAVTPDDRLVMLGSPGTRQALAWYRQLATVLAHPDLARVIALRVLSPAFCPRLPTREEAWQGARVWFLSKWSVRNHTLPGRLVCPWYLPTTLLARFHIPFDAAQAQPLRCTLYSAPSRRGGGGGGGALVHTREGGTVVPVSAVVGPSENLSLWLRPCTDRLDEWWPLATWAQTDRQAVRAFRARYLVWQRQHAARGRSLPSWHDLSEHDQELSTIRVGPTTVTASAILRALARWCWQVAYRRWPPPPPPPTIPTTPTTPTSVANTNRASVPTILPLDERCQEWLAWVVELTASQCAVYLQLPYVSDATCDQWVRRISAAQQWREQRLPNWFHTTWVGALERADLYTKRLLYPDLWLPTDGGGVSEET